MADSCSAVPALAPPVWRSGADGLLHLGADKISGNASILSPTSCADSGHGGGCHGSGFAVFCRFGGAFHSDSGVPWESAARTQYTVLNEAVLDDGQAMYRAYHTHARATQRAMRPISDGELYEAIAALGGNPDAGTPITAFERRTTAAPLERRPHHVVVILGENYALWPLLPEYDSLGLEKTGKWLETHGAHIYHFLANGNGTMTSLNGFLTGLPDIGLYVNYTMGLQGKASPFGIGETMKRLGYKTVFGTAGSEAGRKLIILLCARGLMNSIAPMNCRTKGKVRPGACRMVSF